jgi:hypothetical protein
LIISGWFFGGIEAKHGYVACVVYVKRLINVAVALLRC